MSFDTLNNSLDINEGHKGKEYMGVVVNNVDPLNKDRVQISIPGLYEQDGSPLPWVAPYKSSSFGNGNGWGSYGTPQVGSKVSVTLQGGDPHYPKYTGAPAGDNRDFQAGLAYGFTDPYGNNWRVSPGIVSFTTKEGCLVTLTAGKINIEAPAGVLLSSNVSVDGNLQVNGVLTVADGATGTFNSNGTIVTVKNGIITNIK